MRAGAGRAREDQRFEPARFDPFWEPIVRACAETGTVLFLHVGSAGFGSVPPGTTGGKG